MKRTSFVLAASVALVGLPAAASAADSPTAVSGAGITYTVPVNAGGGVAGHCTFVADRWTADYGPTTVDAAAVSPLGVWTRIRCTVTKNGDTYIDAGRTEYGVLAVLSERAGAIPAEGIEVCAEVESQFTVDARPFARTCATF